MTEMKKETAVEIIEEMKIASRAADRILLLAEGVMSEEDWHSLRKQTGKFLGCLHGDVFRKYIKDLHPELLESLIGKPSENSDHSPG